jgi:hypothetical protein
VLGCAGLALLGCIGFVVFTLLTVNTLTQPVVTAGDSFMNALKAGNYSAAFNLCTPDLQQQVGDANGLQAAMSVKQPTSWSWSSKSINNGLGSLEGSASFADGSKGTANLEFRQIGGDWKVSYANLK